MRKVTRLGPNAETNLSCSTRNITEGTFFPVKSILISSVCTYDLTSKSGPPVLVKMGGIGSQPASENDHSLSSTMKLRWEKEPRFSEDFSACQLTSIRSTDLAKNPDLENFSLNIDSISKFHCANDCALALSSHRHKW